MNDIEVSSIDLVEGGNVFKQGHYLTLGYIPRDENGATVDLNGKTLKVSLWGYGGIAFESAATFSGGVIRFTLNETVPAGDYQVEFTATSSTDVNYRKKFPTNSNAARISVNRSADDAGELGISIYTIEEFEKKQKVINDTYKATVDGKVLELETEFDAAVGAVTVDSEVVIARGDEPTLNQRLQRDKVVVDEQIAKTAKASTGFISRYADAVNGDDVAGNGTSANPFKSIQRMIDSLPSVIVHDVVLNLAPGTYIDASAESEWGQKQMANFTGKFFKPVRDSSVPLNTKAAKITIQGTNMNTVILDGGPNAIRTGIYANSKDILLKRMTMKNFTGALVVHQGGDVSAYELTLTGNETGVSVESDARFECGYSTISGNTTDIYSKNGQLQMNDTVINGLVTIEGSPYQIFERCSGSILFDLKGCDYLDIKTCDFFGGTDFIKGYFTYIRISADTHIHKYTSNVFVPATGLINVLNSHIWANNFVVFVSEGNGNIRFSNCDSKNKEGVDTPNTQSTPFRMYNQGTVDFINSTILPNAVLQRPTSGMVLKGGAPPTTGYHEKGKILLNEATALGQRAGFSCIAAGTPGTWAGFGQVEHRVRTASPVGQVTPFYIGEEILDVTNKIWYKATGTTSTDWKQMTT